GRIERLRRLMGYPKLNIVSGFRVLWMVIDRQPRSYVLLELPRIHSFGESARGDVEETSSETLTQIGYEWRQHNASAVWTGVSQGSGAASISGRHLI
ncbi:hypothetical protein HAX54_010683, partial [Datura stramonium]|nr:hypothetical protein [Datura stramonium]